MRGLFMHFNRIFLFVLALQAPYAFSMNPGIEPIEVEQGQNDADIIKPSLQTLASRVAAQQIQSYFEDSKTGPSVLYLPLSTKNILRKRIMFGPDEHILDRNPLILWLLLACHVPRMRKPLTDEQFAQPLISCNGMSLRKVPDTLQSELINDETQEVIGHCDSEIPLEVLQFNPSGSHVYLMDTGHRLEIARVYDWQVERRMQVREANRTHRCQLIPDCSMVLSAGKNSLRIHDIITGQPICDLIRGSADMISEVKISQDSNVISVFYHDIDNENLEELMRDLDRPCIIIDQFDISELREILQQLDKAPLEHLLVLQLVHRIAHFQSDLGSMRGAHLREHGTANGDQLVLQLARRIAQNKSDCAMIRAPHILQHYNALPDTIKVVIERTLPDLKNKLESEKNKASAEPELKRAKTDSDEQ